MDCFVSPCGLPRKDGKGCDSAFCVESQKNSSLRSILKKMLWQSKILESFAESAESPCDSNIFYKWIFSMDCFVSPYGLPRKDGKREWNR